LGVRGVAALCGEGVYGVCVCLWCLCAALRGVLRRRLRQASGLCGVRDECRGIITCNCPKLGARGCRGIDVERAIVLCVTGECARVVVMCECVCGVCVCVCVCVCDCVCVCCDCDC